MMHGTHSLLRLMHESFCTEDGRPSRKGCPEGKDVLPTHQARCVPSPTIHPACGQMLQRSLSRPQLDVKAGLAYMLLYSSKASWCASTGAAQPRAAANAAALNGFGPAVHRPTGRCLPEARASLPPAEAVPPAPPLVSAALASAASLSDSGSVLDVPPTLAAMSRKREAMSGRPTLIGTAALASGSL